MQGARLNESTIGIQNAAKNDGLTVVFNAAYVRNGLAVEFRPPANWLRVTRPRLRGRRTGDRSGRPDRFDRPRGGDYTATIRILSNDPVNGLIQVPCRCMSSGSPTSTRSRRRCSSRRRSFGFSSSQVLNVRTPAATRCTHGLSVEGEFAAAGLTPPVDIRPGGSIPVTVSFLPLDEGTRLGALTLVSDDPDEGTVIVPLQGEGLWPPEIQVTPPEIRTALPPGGNRHKNLNIANAGARTCSERRHERDLRPGIGYPGTYVELEKGERTSARGSSAAAGRPVRLLLDGLRRAGRTGLRVVDIRGSAPRPSARPPTATTATPARSRSVQLPVLRGLFNSLRVVTNGWLSFTSTKTTYTNQPLPNTGSTVPENLLAPFWDDLVLRAGTDPSRRRRGSGTTTTGRGSSSSSRTCTASQLRRQPHLPGHPVPERPDRVSVQTMASSTLNSATIGMQNATRDDGLTVVFNAGYIHDRWPSSSRRPGVAQALADEGVIRKRRTRTSTSCSTRRPRGRDPRGTIQIHSNDPYTPLVEVPGRHQRQPPGADADRLPPKVLRLADTSILRVRMRSSCRPIRPATTSGSPP